MPHSDLAAAIDSLRESARIEYTPCGDGQMVWRRWGQGKPLALFHGGGGSWEHWAANIESLSQHREIWCPDFPSFGDSGDVPAPGQVDEIAQITADGLDQLFSKRIDIAGFSFGAMVGTLIAHERPGRVGRLILVGAASLGVPRNHPPLQVWRKATDPVQRMALHRTNLHILMLASPEPDDAALALHARNVERARYNGRRLAFSTRLLDLLDALDVTRLDAIYGEFDATCDGNLALVESVIRERRPEARLIGIPGAGHWVQYEGAAACETAILALLDD